MSDTKIIRAKLRRLLPTLDLETATQRTIQQQLEDELGISLDAYKAVLKAEVDAFLLGQEPLEDEDTAELDEPAPKKLKPAPSPLQNNSEGPAGYSFSVPIASKRYAGVRTYNGRAMIDVREFYDKDGQLAPGAKGLSMNADQWAALTAGMQPLSEALSRGDEAFFVDLGGSKRAAVSPFGGKMFIGLREYYEKDGKMLPGKKGISLPPDQWAKLCAVHEELTPKLRAAGGVPSPVKSAAAGAPQPGAAGVVSPAAGPSVPSSELKSEGAIVSIVLAPLRRAEVVEWKGKRNVDLREFYVKDGKLAHTKKGLQLTPEQFATLKERAGEVTAALKAHDAAFEVALSSKRKVTLSCFKGRWSVDIREYYEKDGALAPGQKGLALSPEQWDKLREGLPELSTALEAA